MTDPAVPWSMKCQECAADLGGLDKKAAGAHIRRYAGEHVPDGDHRRFSELAETELMALHEGSIARYRLRPSEYQTWHAVWR